MYELQLFDSDINQYVPVETGDDPLTLMEQAKGMARRVVSVLRGSDPAIDSDCPPKCYNKPLPLKPRIPYGLSGKSRKYGKETMILPADVYTLASRAETYYRERAETESLPVVVYVWRGAQFTDALRQRLAKYQPKNSAAVFRFMELDPDEYL